MPSLLDPKGNNCYLVFLKQITCNPVVIVIVAFVQYCQFAERKFGLKLRTGLTGLNVKLCLLIRVTEQGHKEGRGGEREK